MQTPEAVARELKLILALTEEDTHRAYQIVEHQLSVLVVRTQVLLSLCGIVITVTGFSGRAIAETSMSARLLIATGIAIVLASAAVAMWGVLRLQWLTQVEAPDWKALLTRGLEIRNRKSRFLSGSLVLFLVGFSCYVAAIVQLLLAAQPR